MPSLRMKKNPSVCCLSEKECLHVCKMSNVIAKRSCSSHLKIPKLAAEVGATHCSHEVSPSSELIGQGNETTGATNCDDVLSGEDTQFKRQTSSSDDFFMIGGMELPNVSCSANLATIFSPTLGHVDNRNAPNSYDSSGCNNSDQDPFRFSTTDESDGNSGSFSDHQTCNISDFYISDMVLAGLPFVGTSLCDGVAETLMFTEYDTAESNIFFDNSNGRITSPFLGDLAESSERLEGQPCGEIRGEYDSSSFLLAIHQICPGDLEPDLRPCGDFDEAHYFDPHSFIRNLPDLSDVPNGRPTMLPKESREKKPMTLVLDLDETLVHSTLEQCEDADFTFTVFFNMKEHTVYVKERPHLREFLKKVASMFEVVVFTASQSIYAEQLLDILDPDGKLISGRAYRESCIFSDGSYTKDLTVLGLDLAKVVIIDNSPQVFRLQVNNGIPIKSWFDDPSDNELFSLIPFLETLADADDVRPLIAKRFDNKE